MINISDVDGIAMINLTAVGYFNTRQHFKERGLARAVRSDDADNAARRQRKRKIINQQFVTKGLAQVFDFDHLVAKTRSRWNVDLIGFAARLKLLIDEIIKARNTRLAFCLASLGIGAHPFELRGDALASC